MSRCSESCSAKSKLRLVAVSVTSCNGLQRRSLGGRRWMNAKHRHNMWDIEMGRRVKVQVQYVHISASGPGLKLNTSHLVAQVDAGMKTLNTFMSKQLSDPWSHHFYSWLCSSVYTCTANLKFSVHVRVNVRPDVKRILSCQLPDMKSECVLHVWRVDLILIPDTTKNTDANSALYAIRHIISLLYLVIPVVYNVTV